MREVCLTLAASPHATLPDVLTLLTNAGFRRHFLAAYPPRPVLATLWQEYDQLTAPQRTNLCAPLASRLRAVLSHSFARTKSPPPASPGPCSSTCPTAQAKPCRGGRDTMADPDRAESPDAETTAALPSPPHHHRGPSQPARPAFSGHAPIRPPGRPHQRRTPPPRPAGNGHTGQDTPPRRANQRKTSWAG